ncbi:unnamed protein product [Heterotrigona itama]|uniref:Uncharacterized protein n=1 Tax=Heterotrigona itama TaxID=395501 RepID=A0A6V7HDP9_9HYME|nr:unnamed protein product [Heterotrigona itama]
MSRYTVSLVRRTRRPRLTGFGMFGSDRQEREFKNEVVSDLEYESEINVNYTAYQTERNRLVSLCYIERLNTDLSLNNRNQGRYRCAAGNVNAVSCVEGLQLIDDLFANEP